MQQQFYQFSLILTALINFGMAFKLFRGTARYARYPIYRRTRLLTVLWLVIFGIGYILHAVFQFRWYWPAVSTALTTTYFHIGAICFSWGYTSLLNPDFLTRKVVIRDLAIYVLGLVAYWTVALTWKEQPFYTTLATGIFFLYAAYGTLVFYKTYNLVSLRMIKITNGNMGSFVRWLQLCCDLIILFGIGGVALTGIFPHEIWPYIVLCWLSPVMFGYIVYSLSNYGAVVEDATRISENTHTTA